MKYIGNKTRLLSFIEDCLVRENIDYINVNVMDLFAGTGSVSSFFLKNGCNVVSCDNMFYSECEQYRVNYYNVEPTFEELYYNYGISSLEEVLIMLNKLPGQKGYFYQNYAPGGSEHRQYFSDSNAMKIDAIREMIRNWESLLPPEKVKYLLGILMCSADRVSNTSGTYGAYLKIWRSMALKNICLEKPEIISKGNATIVVDDVMNCANNHKNNDIVYLDPPYNTRQYASNFHVLENIVVYDRAQLNGKTGLRPYENQRSDYCISSKVLPAFESLIDVIDSKYIVMSYSTEGLMSENDIINTMKTKGAVSVYRNSYRRFKTNAWTEGDTDLEELLFICKCE